MISIWQADANVVALVNEVKSKNHPHLAEATFAVGFLDAKPFQKNRLNVGKVSRFSKQFAAWNTVKYDFCLLLNSESWHAILTPEQREASIDLHLCRCKVDYEPRTEVINGVKKIIRDDHGRIEYTQDPKTEDDGSIKYVILPMDLLVVSENVKRYGAWLDDMLTLKEAISDHA